MVDLQITAGGTDFFLALCFDFFIGFVMYIVSNKVFQAFFSTAFLYVL